MKICRLSLALLCTAALFSQCKTARYTSDQLPDESLRFGKGGGFTGIAEGDIISFNGVDLTATYLGGDGNEFATDIAVDDTGAAYVAGYAGASVSIPFPTLKRSTGSTPRCSSRRRSKRCTRHSKT